MLTLLKGFGASGTRHPIYPVQTDAGRPPTMTKSTDMSGLEALVAVATSEEKATPAARR